MADGLKSDTLLGSQRPLVDGPVQERGQDTEKDHAPPDEILGPGSLKGAPSKPGPQEATELVHQKDNTDERRQLTGHQQSTLDHGRKRHSSQPAKHKPHRHQQR